MHKIYGECINGRVGQRACLAAFASTVKYVLCMARVVSWCVVSESENTALKRLERGAMDIVKLICGECLRFFIIFN